MKYLIVEDFSGQEVPFIFPRRVDHSDMREQLPYSRVVSAGFVELGPEGFACSGGNPCAADASVSLGQARMFKSSRISG